MLSKSSWATLTTIFKTVLGPSQVIIIGGVVFEKSKIFEFSDNISAILLILIFLYEIFFASKMSLRLSLIFNLLPLGESSYVTLTGGRKLYFLKYFFNMIMHLYAFKLDQSDLSY